MSGKLAEGLSAELREVLVPLLTEIESLNERIKEYDERMDKIAKEGCQPHGRWPDQSIQAELTWLEHRADEAALRVQSTIPL